MDQNAFRHTVVQLLSLVILVLSIGLLAFYEYVTVMFGHPTGPALDLFPDLGWAVFLLSVLIFLGNGLFTIKTILMSE